MRRRGRGCGRRLEGASKGLGITCLGTSENADPTSVHTHLDAELAHA